MPSDRVNQAMESLKIAFNNTASVEENFESLVTAIYFKSDADCYIAFDTSANADDYKVSSTDGFAHIEAAQFTKLSVLGASGSGNLYVIACRT